MNCPRSHQDPGVVESERHRPARVSDDHQVGADLVEERGRDGGVHVRVEDVHSQDVVQAVTGSLGIELTHLN